MLPTEDTPVTRAKRHGINSTTSIDLVSIGYSRREEDALETIGRDVWRRFQSIGALGQASPDELTRLTGIDGFDMLRCQCLIELGRRIGKAERGEPVEVSDPYGVAKHLEHLRREKQEHFYVLHVDAKNRILRTQQVHVGTLSMSVVGPREVFREAIREAASSIVVAHNHPSGDPTPSPEDIEITRKLRQIGELLDIPLLDHVIIGDPRHVSLRERGVL